MTTLIACDQCTKCVPERGRVGWLTLDQEGVALIRFGEPEYPLHFCSLACLAAWAEQHDNPPAAALDGWRVDADGAMRKG